MSGNEYVVRRRAFAQAIEACEELIRDYEKRFYVEAAEAVRTAIVRIQCAEDAKLRLVSKPLEPR